MRWWIILFCVLQYIAVVAYAAWSPRHSAVFAVFALMFGMSIGGTLEQERQRRRARRAA